jgi:ethanolamine-phosphate phospho-lyase
MDYLQYLEFPEKVVAAKPLSGYGSINYKITLANNENYLLKIYNSNEAVLINEEANIIAQIAPELNIQLPTKASLQVKSNLPEHLFCRVMPFIEGENLNATNASDAILIQIASQAALMLQALQTIKSPIIKAHEHDWNLRDALQVAPKATFIKPLADKKIVDHFFAHFKNDIAPLFASLRQSVLHSDLNEANIILQNNQLKGFIDFGDISYAPVVCELAILLTYIMLLFPEQEFTKAAIIVKQFTKHFALTQEELQILPALIATRLCVSVCKSAEAKAKNIDTDYILISEQPAWNLLRKWITYNPIFLQNFMCQAAGFSIKNANSQQLLERRKTTALPSLSLSYATPIHMETALFQYMYDANGATYLDAYNNIPHVGHCHPAVVLAAEKQLRKLNTNTRYLYSVYADYSEKLLTLFPNSFNKVALVNSGSEASDLAIRMAKTIQQKNGIAIIAWSYHGNTQNGINISSYKFDRKGGKGPAENILRLPLPKAYNGNHQTAAAYVAEAIQHIEAFEAAGNELAAFIAEPISGCGGQVPLFEGYLALLVPYLKAKGIIVIIDEVQTGFGRLGKNFWGFEMHNIVPDMVVLGKPIANGHPMGAVITNNNIASAFENGMEFFSSFGGNPVSCAIGHAVIETIQNEGLQQQALEVGNYWQSTLKQLQHEYKAFGDVRGEGLFIGVECIDQQGKENTALAQILKNGLKEDFILASTDGPLDNVLKMKPPLCFSKNNVNQFVESLQKLMKAQTNIF